MTGTAPVIVEAADDSSASVQPLDPAAGLAETVIIEEPIETAAAVPAEILPIQQIQTNDISAAAIKVNPGIPPAESGKSYRIQVGSYRNAKYAVDAFTALKNAGLLPAYERYNDFYRVVLAQVETDKIQSTVDIIAEAGFGEILIKEER